LNEVRLCVRDTNWVEEGDIDFEKLQNLLRCADFTQMEWGKYTQNNCPNLMVDHFSAVACAIYRDQHYSLFVEVN
jgi:hypothetical protein